MPDTPSPARAVRFAHFVLAALIAVQPACSSLYPRVPPPPYQEQIHRIAIVAASQSTDIAIESFGRSKGFGATHTGGTTFISCLTSLSHSHCTGDVCGGLLLIGLGVCGIAGLVGAGLGAASAPTADQATHALSESERLLSSQNLHRALKDQLVAVARQRATPQWVDLTSEMAATVTASRDYRPLAALGIDTAVEVGVARFVTAGRWAGISLIPIAETKLIRTMDNTVIFSEHYRLETEGRKAEDWLAEGGRRLLDGVADSLAALSIHIHDYAFSYYPLPNRAPHMAGGLAAAFGLAPIEPTTRGQLTGDPILGNWLEWKLVDSLQPTLRWEAFPRADDLIAAPEDMTRVRNVRYDLVIAREKGLSPEPACYRREGLTTPAHHLETPLAPDARYFWSIRARFELDGRERVTEWSSTAWVARQQFTAPSSFSYRFRTP